MLFKWEDPYIPFQGSLYSTTLGRIPVWHSSSVRESFSMYVLATFLLFTGGHSSHFTCSVGVVRLLFWSLLWQLLVTMHSSFVRTSLKVDENGRIFIHLQAGASQLCILHASTS